ncbi:cytochrome c family protein [Rhodobacteraceae bacterium NNCM2]|nr:cytochrome c family protein [Coraliihabitans acroporae]
MKKLVQIVGAMALIATGTAAQAGDAAKGEKVFRKCKACHKLEEGKNAVGPSLYAIVNSPIASVDGFSYSDAMATYGEGKTWTVEELDAFLTKPKAHIKGTKMSFAGLRKEDQRADVIAYLETIQ